MGSFFLWQNRALLPCTIMVRPQTACQGILGPTAELTEVSQGATIRLNLPAIRIAAGAIGTIGGQAHRTETKDEHQ